MSSAKAWLGSRPGPGMNRHGRHPWKPLPIAWLGDEKADGRGMYSTCPDVQGEQDGDDTVKLRAGRREYGDGRVYHLDFTAEDGKGGVCNGSVTVCVPDHDRRGRPRCVDQGAVYDSTTCMPRRHHHHRGCGHRHWHRGH